MKYNSIRHILLICICYAFGVVSSPVLAVDSVATEKAGASAAKSHKTLTTANKNPALTRACKSWKIRCKP